MGSASRLHPSYRFSPAPGVFGQALINNQTVQEIAPMTTRQELIPVTLANGAKIRVAATVLGGEEDVAFKLLSFDEVTKTIEGIADSLQTALQKIKPKKASVEFGLEIGVESGALTTLLVKGSGTATLNITLEWGD
jgi:hypothetical protein